MPVIELDEADRDRVIAIDLKGTYLMMKSVLPQKIRQDFERIAIISSVAGREGNPNMGAYWQARSAWTHEGCSPRAVFGMTYGSTRCAHPDSHSLVGSAFRRAGQISEQQIPPEQIGASDEVADLVAFLIDSQAVGFITEQAFSFTSGRADF